MFPGYFWGSGMWLFPLIGMSFMLFVVYMIFGRGNFGTCGNKNSNSDTQSAIEILKQRYAKGEISREEFEQMKKDIMQK